MLPWSAVGAENPRTGKTSAEKMLKYMEERMKVKDALAEKLQLKNAAFKVHQGSSPPVLMQTLHAMAGAVHAEQACSGTEAAAELPSRCAGAAAAQVLRQTLLMIGPGQPAFGLACRQ